MDENKEQKCLNMRFEYYYNISTNRERNTCNFNIYPNRCSYVLHSLLFVVHEMAIDTCWAALGISPASSYLLLRKYGTPRGCWNITRCTFPARWPIVRLVRNIKMPDSGK